MRFDLECARPSIANIDDASILPGTLNHELAAGRQSFQVHTRRLVRTMLTPHHAENSELGDGRLASAQKPFDFLVLVRSDSVLPDDFRGDGRGQGRGHGEYLLSHPGTRQLKRKTDFFPQNRRWPCIVGRWQRRWSDGRLALRTWDDWSKIELIQGSFADFANDQRPTTND